MTLKLSICLALSKLKVKIINVDCVSKLEKVTINVTMDTFC